MLKIRNPRVMVRQQGLVCKTGCRGGANVCQVLENAMNETAKSGDLETAKAYNNELKNWGCKS